MAPSIVMVIGSRSDASFAVVNWNPVTIETAPGVMMKPVLTLAKLRYLVPASPSMARLGDSAAG